MKNVVSVFLMVVLLSFKLSAQTGVMDFESNSYDFGNVKEESEKISHDFKFVNKGKAPIIISNVEASCGCTTPTWPKEPIMPGQSATIKAEYSTTNRPGVFNKTITITANTEPSNTTLSISGTVIPKNQTPEEEMPRKIGALRTTSETLDIGQLSTKEPDTKEFPVYNDGASPITFQAPANLPKNLVVTVTPLTLAPKQRGSIKVTYDAKKKNDVGPVFDKFVLITNEATDNKKSFTVTADISEYFPPLTPEQKALIPRIEMGSMAQDFGQVKLGSVNTAEISITNKGKQDLIIRKVRTNSSALAAVVDVKIIKAGQQAKLKVTYKPAKKGLDPGVISIYNNDPTTPLLYFSTKAKVSE